MSKSSEKIQKAISDLSMGLAGVADVCRDASDFVGERFRALADKTDPRLVADAPPIITKKEGWE